MTQPEVIIYTKADGPCHWCDRAKGLFKHLGWEYDVISVGETGLISKDELRNILRFGPEDKLTVPQIYIDAIRIGGYTELIEYLQQKGLWNG